jgi:hypothetical protein
MKYLVETTEEQYLLLRPLLTEFDRGGTSTQTGPCAFEIDIARDGSNLDVIKVLFSAIRAGQVKKFTVWEEDGSVLSASRYEGKP